MAQTQKPFVDKDKLKKKLEVSNFDPNAIVRGAQLTVVGAVRALRNPDLFTSDHYKQAAIAVALGIIIRLAIEIPVLGVRVLLWVLSFFIDFQASTFDDKVIEGLKFTQDYVLQIPFFLMTFLRYLVPTMDNMFMMSLAFVDKTYYEKHKNEDPATLRAPYYPNLRQYSLKDGSTHTKSTAEAFTMFLMRFGKKAALSLAVFALSYVPIIGRFVLPAASFYTFNKVAGLGPAAIVFGTGIFLPRRYLVIFLQTYFSSRSLMRELLEPYFSRIHFSSSQKRHWFHDREGLLFGFGVGFYIFLRIPLLGVLVYGIAEASTAYLITKITDPPPRPGSKESEVFAESQERWRNKHEFLKEAWNTIDALQVPNGGKEKRENEVKGLRDDPPAYEEVKMK